MRDVRWVRIGLHQLPARMRKSARRREPHGFFNSLLGLGLKLRAVGVLTSGRKVNKYSDLGY